MLCAPKFVKYVARDCATDLTAIRIDELTWKNYTYQVVFFMAPWTPNYIYSAKHYVTVLHEGPPALLFDQPSNPASPASL